MENTNTVNDNYLAEFAALNDCPEFQKLIK